MSHSKQYDINGRNRKCTWNCFGCYDSEDTKDDNNSTQIKADEPQCGTAESSFSECASDKDICDKGKIYVESRKENHEMRDMEVHEGDMACYTGDLGLHENDISKSFIATVSELESTTSNCCQCDSLTITQNQALLNKIDEQDQEIKRLRKAVENIALNPTYIKVSRCENVSLSTGGGDIDSYTKQIHKMLDNLCENYDKLKGTAVTILEKVEDIQTGSTEQRVELHTLMGDLKSILDTSGTPLSADTRQDSQYCSLNSLVDFENPCQDNEDCRCVVWGRSNVLRDLKDTQVKILNRLDSIEETSRKNGNTC